MAAQKNKSFMSKRIPFIWRLVIYVLAMVSLTLVIHDWHTNSWANFIVAMGVFLAIMLFGYAIAPEEQK